MAALTSDRLDVALAPLRDMLAADGYQLRLSLDATASSLVMDIQATDAACAECLAPAATIDAVAWSYLSNAGVREGEITLDIQHPVKAS